MIRNCQHSKLSVKTNNRDEKNASKEVFSFSETFHSSRKMWKEYQKLKIVKKINKYMGAS